MAPTPPLLPKYEPTKEAILPIPLADVLLNIHQTFFVRVMKYQNGLLASFVIVPSVDSGKMAKASYQHCIQSFNQWQMVTNIYHEA